MIQYATGTKVNATFTGDTKANIITAIQTNLTTAGWSVVSGGGTTNLVMQTATTPEGLKMRYRFRDLGGSCVCIGIENAGDLFAVTASSMDTGNNGIHLFPAASEVWRVIANKYQAFVFAGAASIGSFGRKVAQFGVPYIPTFLVGVITEAGWLQGDGRSDSSTNKSGTLRTNASFNYFSTGNQACICNGVLFQIMNSDDTNRINNLSTVVPGDAHNTYAYRSGWRWHNLDSLTSDVLLCWGLAGQGDEPLIRGQMWDAIWIADAQVADATTSFDSHNWFNLTNSAPQANGGGSAGWARGGVWVVVP